MTGNNMIVGPPRQSTAIVPHAIASRVSSPLPSLQQLHSKPSQQNYDDLIGAVTKSASKRAEMMLLDIFVVALEYIKSVRTIFRFRV